ncbi:class I SAM-dependent methyltransferase [Specibacter cremeus]|uniref:methyltransferase n=1 Tax=Specibacter cremeus TaxID=1629051 RepID=UPI000F7AD8F1|nr:class I SAM-dependent methyltransferase [Specibacter cremeus]
MADHVFGNPRFYDRRAAAYDAMVSSPLYNRIAWGTHPDDYAAFAARAMGSARGPLLEVAAGTASATAVLHVASGRETTLVDLSRPMLARAERAIARAAGGTVPARIRFECRDLLVPIDGAHYETILGLGLLHLVDDVPGLVDGLAAQLEPGGALYLASLVTGSRLSTAYLNLLHRRGEVAAVRSAVQLRAAVARSRMRDVTVTGRGSMAYVIARSQP